MGTRRRIVQTLIMLVTIGIFAFYFYALNHKVEGAVRVGMPAIDFTAEDLDGNMIRLSDFKGEVVVINFFATWCPPCKEEAPELQKFETHYKDKAKLLFIDRGEPKERVKKFADELQSTSTYLLDSKNELSINYGVVGQPETFVVDKQGIVREYVQGPMKYEELSQLVEKYQ